jgi:hypothetical protein
MSVRREPEPIELASPVSTQGKDRGPNVVKTEQQPEHEAPRSAVRLVNFILYSCVKILIVGSLYVGILSFAALERNISRVVISAIAAVAGLLLICDLIVSLLRIRGGGGR